MTTPDTSLAELPGGLEHGEHFIIDCTCGNRIARCCCGRAEDDRDVRRVSIDKGCVACQAHVARVALEWDRLIKRARVIDALHNT